MQQTGEPSGDLSVVELRAICENLNAEPLHHMSLGSRELFHSNLLAWFADQFPSVAADVFRPWTRQDESAKGRPTEREAAHLDLVFHLPGLAPIAVENKVWSIPDDAQLGRYANGVLRDRERVGPKYSRILLSLMPPDWEAGSYAGWTPVSYRQLANRLALSLRAITSEQAFGAEVLEHYVGLIHSLDLLASQLAKLHTGAKVNLPEPVLEILRRCRLSAGIQKARASQVAQEVRRALLTKGITGARVAAGFTNGTPLVEAFLPVSTAVGDPNPPDWIGWQLQGAQFRLAVICGRLQGRAQRTARESYVATQYVDWFDLRTLSPLTSGRAEWKLVPDSANRFLSYAPDFVYRYVSVPSISVAELCDAGVAFLQRATQLYVREQV